jgi:SAM-dependent methyltransferase
MPDERAPIRLIAPPADLPTNLAGPSPEFWESEHVAYNENRKIVNLSGYGLGAYSDCLDILDLAAKAAKVLDIGVGTCQAIRDLKAMGKQVGALDCCPTALVRAHREGARTYTAPEKLPDNEFDLILCHLVSQHLPDDILLDLLTHAFRSLTPAGTLAIQSADVPGRVRQAFQFVAAGNILRDESQMRDLLARAGAKWIKLVKTIEIYPVWMGFHAR